MSKCTIHTPPYLYTSLPTSIHTGTINYVRERVKEAESEGVTDEQPEELSLDQVKQRMREVQAGKAVADKSTIDTTNGNNNKGFKEFTVKKDIKETFIQIIERFLSPSSSNTTTLEEIALANYDLCDLKFQEMLQNEADICYKEGANIGV